MSSTHKEGDGPDDREVRVKDDSFILDEKFQVDFTVVKTLL